MWVEPTVLTLVILNRYIVFHGVNEPEFVQLFPVARLFPIFGIGSAPLCMSSYNCLFLPLDIALECSSPRQISRSEGWILLFLHVAPAFSRRPRQSEWPPYSRFVPTALTTSDFIIFIYVYSFNRHISRRWSYGIPVSFIACETGHTSMWGFTICFSLCVNCLSPLTSYQVKSRPNLM